MEFGHRFWHMPTPLQVSSFKIIFFHFGHDISRQFAVEMLIRYLIYFKIFLFGFCFVFSSKTLLVDICNLVGAGSTLPAESSSPSARPQLYVRTSSCERTKVVSIAQQPKIVSFSQQVVLVAKWTENIVVARRQSVISNSAKQTEYTPWQERLPKLFRLCPRTVLFVVKYHVQTYRIHE